MSCPALGRVRASRKGQSGGSEGGVWGATQGPSEAHNDPDLGSSEPFPGRKPTVWTSGDSAVLGELRPGTGASIYRASLHNRVLRGHLRPQKLQHPNHCGFPAAKQGPSPLDGLWWKQGKGSHRVTLWTGGGRSMRPGLVGSQLVLPSFSPGFSGSLGPPFMGRTGCGEGTVGRGFGDRGPCRFLSARVGSEREERARGGRTLRGAV